MLFFEVYHFYHIMKLNPRNARKALVRPSPPTYMDTNSVLIQTDSGRRFDASIRYNRIIQYPDQRNTNSLLKNRLVTFMSIALLVSFLLYPERFAIVSLQLAVSNRKYLGETQNNTGRSNIVDEHENGIMDLSTINDEFNDDDLLRDADDDDRDVETDASNEVGQSINNSRGFKKRNITLLEEDSDNVLFGNASNHIFGNPHSGTL